MTVSLKSLIKSGFTTRQAKVLEELAPSGTSSAVGAPLVRAFPFTFDTPDLLTGAALYTPTVGDILLDAWIEIDTAWDGTTPRGDFGTFVGAAYGIFGGGVPGVPVDLTQAEDEGLGAGIQVQESGIARPFTASSMNYHATPGYAFNKYVPAKFTAGHPVKVVVSRNGQNDGADPGSTQGAAVLYLVTATPV